MEQIAIRCAFMTVKKGVRVLRGSNPANESSHTATLVSATLIYFLLGRVTAQSVKGGGSRVQQ